MIVRIKLAVAVSGHRHSNSKHGEIRRGKLFWFHTCLSLALPWFNLPSDWSENIDQILCSWSNDQNVSNWSLAKYHTLIFGKGCLESANRLCLEDADWQTHVQNLLLAVIGPHLPWGPIIGQNLQVVAQFHSMFVLLFCVNKAWLHDWRSIIIQLDRRSHRWFYSVIGQWGWPLHSNQCMHSATQMSQHYGKERPTLALNTPLTPSSSADNQWGGNLNPFESVA